MLYGFKRKTCQAQKGFNFADVVQEISEEAKKANRKRSTAYARVEHFNEFSTHCLHNVVSFQDPVHSPGTTCRGAK